MAKLETSLGKLFGVKSSNSSVRRPLGIILVALAIRLAVAPFTGHPFDLSVWINTGKYIVQGKSPYELYYHLGYPPLWGLWTALAYVVSSIISNGNLYLYIFFIKLPIILADLGVAYFLWRLSFQYAEKNGSGSPKLKEPVNLGSNGLGNKLVSAYLLSPFTIIIGSVWGMMDALVVLLIVLAVVTLFSRKDSLSGLFLGLAVSLKTLPLDSLSCLWSLFVEGKGSKREKVTSVLRSVCTVYRYDIIAPISVV